MLELMLEAEERANIMTIYVYICMYYVVMYIRLKYNYICTYVVSNVCRQAK